MESELTTPQEKRHCVELNLSGQPCGLPAVAGRDRCYIHGLYRALNNGRCSIDVPLLEDENALLFVYSEVARALAQGAMPAANATGILRCCRGAQRLLEERSKRERLEEKKRARQSTEENPQISPPASTPQPEPDQVLAAVPGNLEDSAENSGAELSPDSALANSAPSLQDSDATGEPNTFQASTSCAERESEATAEPRPDPESEPQPWTIEPDRKVVPPPQFADAREKFDQTLARQEGDLTMALIQRGREIRARGGHGLDGVINNIRDTY